MGRGDEGRKTVRKWLLLLCLIPLLLGGSCLAAAASGPQDPDRSGSEALESATPGELEQSEPFQQQLEASGANGLMDDLSDETRALMEQIGIDSIGFTQILSLEPGEFFRLLWSILKDLAGKPLKTLGSVIGIVILCALMNGLKNGVGESSMTPVVNAIGMLCCVTAVVIPLFDCIYRVVSVIQGSTNFIYSFIPVFSSVMTVGGQPVTAGSYSLLLYTAAQIIARVGSTTLIPLLCIYLAFSLVGALSPAMNLTGIAEMIKKTACWILSLMLTIFVGLLGIQGLVGSSADNITMKTTRFLIGSFVPVVGGALSEAFSTAQGCIRLLKTTVGVYGVLAFVMTFLPILLETVLWLWTVNIAAAVSELLEAGTIAKMLKASASVLSILISLILCFALLMIITTTMMLLMGTGG